tara:strand:- start:65 stop:478 length:414 start_codon:yes stop_codon:yes gene_type:complete
MYDDLKNIRKDNKSIRDFGILIGIILLIIAGILFYKERASYQLIIFLGITFIGLGLGKPIILKPFYSIWMCVAVVIGWFMTRLILGLLFYSVVSPISLILRLFGKQFLDLKPSLLNRSYWNYKGNNSISHQNYEKQF